MCHIGPIMAHLSWTKMFWYKSLLLSPTYWPFSLSQIYKNSYSRSRVMRMHHFWAQNDPFAPNKIINIILIYLLAPLTVQNFKKFFQWIQSYEDAQLLGPKWPISPNEIFFRKPVNEPCFFHSCLSTCQKSKSDINLLVKYWWLKNTEISLAKRHFWPDFSQACSFCRRMLINHKKFHLTKIPEKTKTFI